MTHLTLPSLLTTILLLIAVAGSLLFAGVIYNTHYRWSKPISVAGVAVAVGLIALASVACGELGKPSTSAPRADNIVELVQGCDERREKINEWELDQKRQAEGEWIDGRRDLLQSAAKFDQVEREARDMYSELQVNCQEKSKDFPLDGPN